MFCHQCEQSAAGCKQDIGVCGKDELTADLQDILLHVTKGISMYAHRARQLGAKDHDIDISVLEALFTTVTNVNFDPERIAGQIRDAARMRDKARAMYEDACLAAGKTPERLDGPATFQPAEDPEGMRAQWSEASIPVRIERVGEDAGSLQEILIYGIKGSAAYADHAMILGEESEEVFAGFHEALDLVTRDDADAEELFAACMRAGELNLKVMEMLDRGHTSTYGHPEPTVVRTTPVKGKAIVVSGHDLKDLEELLKQTQGKGINVYTHGEMLPAHGYPELKKYPHLVGNYGGAWQKQAKEFDAFPGAILMTTNCIQKPRESYIDRIFTCGLVAWPGVTHIEDRDFTPVIDAALAAEGFAEDAPEETTMVGFGHHAVMSVAEQVVNAVKGGDISHFFLIGGCDGAKPGRNYYTDLADQAPDDTVILTLGCGKYRVIGKDYGDIGGIPRMLDVGQCNDSYSAIQIAVALADAFGVGVNDLPLSLVISWYEQKACAVLLSLLYLGVQDIRLGPTLPQFVSPNILNALVEKFGIKPIGTVEEDLKAMLA